MIIRTARKHRFTVISNDLIEDSDLDWKDLGVLVYLLSKPDDWQISVEHLKKQKKLGRDGVYKCLEAIINAGYARREKNKDGTVSWFVFDEKQKPNPEKPEKAKDSQIRNSRNTENPDPENPTLINTEYKQILSKEITNTDSCANAQSGNVKTPNGFDEFWKVYPKKRSKETAIKAWKKLKPDEQLQKQIIDFVVLAKTQDFDWVKDDGRYIPYPSKFLNEKRWDDEIKNQNPPGKVNGSGFNNHGSNYGTKRNRNEIDWNCDF
jgi:hypothetical protein